MLLEQIAHHAQNQAEKNAYQSRWGSLTYGELWKKANSLASYLQKENGAVMVCGRKEPLMPIAFVACMLAGRPYLPMDAHLPQERMERIGRIADAKTVLLCGECDFHTASAVTAKQLQELCAGDKRVPILQNNERDAYWLFTSGSSGVPKGARISMRALENFVTWMLSLPSVADCADAVAVNQAKFSFDLSVADLWTGLAAGGTVYALDDEEQSDLSVLYRSLKSSGGARLSCTPSFARWCLCDKSFGRELMPQLKTIFLCGEALSPKTANQLHERFDGLRVINAYGPTEAACAVCAVEIEPDARDIPIGTVADAANRLLILDSAGYPLPEGQRGEIAIVGASVGSGYVGNLSGGFGSYDGQPLYRTGDCGEIHNGLLWYHGRLDRQIKYKGYRIEPMEIESAIQQWQQVRAAAVLPIKSAGTVAGLAAFIEWEKEPLKADECQKRLSAVLPAYMLPKRFYTVEKMPMTERGKCDLRKLEEML